MYHDIPFKTDETHKWGTYREIQLDEKWIVRIIRFYVGGLTSVHRHAVDEMLIIEQGLVKCLSGSDPQHLTETIYKPGEYIPMPAYTWHACGAIKGASDDLPYALAVEYVWGDIQDGDYTIERYQESISSPHKKN